MNIMTVIIEWIDKRNCYLMLIIFCVVDFNKMNLHAECSDISCFQSQCTPSFSPQCTYALAMLSHQQLQQKTFQWQKHYHTITSLWHFSFPYVKSASLPHIWFDIRYPSAALELFQAVTISVLMSFSPDKGSSWEGRHCRDRISYSKPKHSR